MQLSMTIFYTATLGNEKSVRRVTDILYEYVRLICVNFSLLNGTGLLYTSAAEPHHGDETPGSETGI
jgi:hypothetical protein